ncbi:MAG: cupredoxin domain-containing protein [DPANN group archaeon]|nr:cupredoxin domain-containing protein [DPANN group archaeon]
MKWIITILTIMLLVTACTTETATEPEIIEEEVEVSEGYELIEMRFVDEIFDPNTIEVSKGTSVRLQFMNGNTFTFSLPDYGIAERVNGNHFIEFVADKEGVFDFECIDCNKATTGVLRVI